MNEYGKTGIELEFGTAAMMPTIALSAAVYHRDNILVTRIALKAVQKVYSVIGSKAGVASSRGTVWACECC